MWENKNAKIKYTANIERIPGFLLVHNVEPKLGLKQATAGQGFSLISSDLKRQAGLLLRINRRGLASSGRLYVANVALCSLCFYMNFMQML